MFCTRCGAIFDEDDRNKHECDPADIPEKGKVIRRNGTVVDLNGAEPPE